MTEELIVLLIVLVSASVLGVVLGQRLRRRHPEACAKFTRSSRECKWWVFAASCVMFSFLAQHSFAGGRAYFGWMFVGFAVLQAAASVYTVYRTFVEEASKSVESYDPMSIDY